MLKPIIEALELSFDFLNSKLFNNELPQPIITIQTKARTQSKGWCITQPIWYNKNEDTFYEINFSAEHINGSYYDLMDTLIHEMCHLSNITKDINDCNKQQYHNKHFKSEAEKAGLIVEKDERYGYAITKLSEQLKTLIDTILVAKDIFTVARFEKPVKKSAQRTKKIKMICPVCHAKVFVENELDIICENCNEKFVVGGK